MKKKKEIGLRRWLKKTVKLLRHAVRLTIGNEADSGITLRQRGGPKFRGNNRGEEGRNLRKGKGSNTSIAKESAFEGAKAPRAKEGKGKGEVVWER